MSRPIVQIVEDARFRSHHGPEGHPERPERLIAVGEAIDAFRDRTEVVAPRPANRGEIQRIHEDRMIDFLASTPERGMGQIDADTYFSQTSYDVACLAAGGTVDLTLRILRGEVDRGFAAVRPPGHHAEAGRSMGFCLFNNIAIAARAAQTEEGAQRILIYDMDVHHGNGSQHSFESDPDVLYISTHQFPFYPGTGDFGDAGIGRGLGATLNVPMPAGCSDTEYVGIVQRIVTPATIAFAPDLILVSAGFDAHRSDPLASMEVSLEGYRAMAAILCSLADDLCGGRILFVLEGGYALDGLRDGTRAVLEGLTQVNAGECPAAASLEPGSVLRGLVDRIVEVHGRRIPALGAA